MVYDLLIKGGRALDPGVGLDRDVDIAVTNHAISKIGPEIDARRAKQVIEARGLVVVPGLIDFHGHAFLGAGDLGVETDDACLSAGVTTFIDGGSAGAATFQGFKELLIDRSRVRLLAFLHISSVGLAELRIGESTYLDLHVPEWAAETASKYPGLILGLKVREQIEAVGKNGLEPLKRAKKAAALAGGLPTMVHVTNPVTPLQDILDLLEPGDIVTHLFHGRGPGILDQRGQVSPGVREARARGIVFDVGHGRKHVNFDVARAAIGEGFLPDTISSDLNRGGRAGVAKNLPHVLSKFMNLGMNLSSVIACATTNPSRLLNSKEKLGTLQEGAIADIAAFQVEEGEFVFEDVDGNKLDGRRRLSARFTICKGQVAWQWSAAD